jgi:hypothetical protein
MTAWLVVILFSVGAVLFFAAGLSLTLMIKGHHIDGEISTNRHMRDRGITCAVQDAYNASSKGSQSDDCDNSSCANCVERCMSTIKS